MIPQILPARWRWHLDLLLILGALLAVGFPRPGSAARILAQGNIVDDMPQALLCNPLEAGELVTAGVVILNSRCAYLPATAAAREQGDIVFKGVTSTEFVPVLDFRLGVSLLELGADIKVTIQDLDVQGVVFFEPGIYTPNISSFQIPAAFGVNSTNSLLIANSTVTTDCETVSLFSEEIGLGSGDVTSVFINNFVNGIFSLKNVELKCDGYPSVGHPLGVVFSAKQLHSTLLTMSEIDEQVIVEIFRNLQLPLDWTPVPIRSNAGTHIQGPQNRTVYWDLSSLPLVLANNGSLQLSNLVIINSCVTLFRRDALHPNERTLLASVLFGVSFQGVTLNDSTINNTVVVVKDYDLKYYTYWGLVLLSPFQRLESLSYFLLVAGFQRMVFVDSPQPNRLAISEFSSSIGSDMKNVTFVTEIPADAPPGFHWKPAQFCESGTLANEANQTNLGMFWAASTTELTAHLRTVSVNSSDSLFSKSYPPVILISGNASLVPPPLQDGRMTTIDSDLLLTGPVENIGTRGGNPTSVMLDLMNGIDLLSVQRSQYTFLYLQRVTLVNVIPKEVIASSNRPSYDSSVTQISGLPLWAFKLSEQRLTPQLLLDSVTLVLVPPDFLQIYYAAQRGAAWKSGSKSTETLILQTMVFDVIQVDEKGILFNAYVGWGLNASNFLLVPSSPVDPGPLGNITLQPPANDPGHTDAGSSSSVALAVGLGVGLGVLLSLIVGGIYYFRWYKPRKASDQNISVVMSKISPSEGSPTCKTGDQELTKSNPGNRVNPREKSSEHAHNWGPGMQKGLNPGVMTMWQQLYETPINMNNSRDFVRNPGSSGPGSSNTVQADKALVSDPTIPSQASNLNGASDTQDGLPTPSPPPAFDPRKEVAQLVEDLSSEGDKLTLLEAIGQGGFGTVYRGRWRNLEVAVKTVLFSESVQTKGRATAQPHQRAILEAAVCSTVIHPNVVITYHYDISPIQKGTTGLNGLTIDESMGNTDWKLYLVQEYCHASMQDALRNYLLHDKNTMAPDMDLVLTVLLDIVRGMSYIHSKNIIHGDLSPGNVLIKQDTESPIGVVGKITDFGLCNKIQPGQSHISNITNGTPFYVAPEVISINTVTKSSDVYSFGVLMWELYRCMPPWVKTQNGFIQNKRFRRFPANSPRPYVLMCAECLSKDGKLRPSFDQIAVEMTAMHAAYLAGYDSLVDPNVSSVTKTPDLVPPPGPQAPLPPLGGARPGAPVASLPGQDMANARVSRARASPSPRASPGLTPRSTRLFNALQNMDMEGDGMQAPTILKSQAAKDNYEDNARGQDDSDAIEVDKMLVR